MKKLLIITLSLITAISAKAQVGIGTATPNSTLQVAGSVSAAIVTITVTPHTAIASEYTILSNCSSASTITLPAASGCTGRIYIIKKRSGASKNVTIQPNTGSEKIDGAGNKLLTTQYDSVMIQSDGANWFILSKN